MEVGTILKIDLKFVWDNEIVGKYKYMAIYPYGHK